MYVCIYIYIEREREREREFDQILQVSIIFQWTSRRPFAFPPGPPAVPFLGSIPFLKHGGAEYYKEFGRLAEKYGVIFSMELGHTLVKYSR